MKASRTFARRDSDGNHRVPNVNRDSDGDWNFNLGNFENDWNDDRCLFCFRDTSDFLPLSIGGSFFLKAFLPAAKLASDLLK